jgi:alanine dehydrogenase
MPGSVPRESTPILANAIFPYLLQILGNGTKDGLKNNAGLRKGLLTYERKVTNEKAAMHWGEQYTDPDTILGGS